MKKNTMHKDGCRRDVGGFCANPCPCPKDSTAMDASFVEKRINDFWDLKARCIASDAIYTDAEMVQILSDALKRSNEESAQFLRKALVDYECYLATGSGSPVGSKS